MSALTELPRALRVLRGRRTQAEMADLLGVSPQTVSDYERGHRRLSVKRLDQILDVLGVSVWELAVALEGRPPAGHDAERDVLREIVRPLISEETERQLKEAFRTFMESRSGGGDGADTIRVDDDSRKRTTG